ncbi:hypothetical protein [Flyfo siphovirus Tbat1_6]|uniref:hypothetical protein n=1 Tax=Flyfo siphovirus Tbat1_6 TaxID=2907287 RepID=UPI00233EB35E|nr:hypothetical protein PRB80_gp20 [Flyfo siphovirus Tbat1_6]UIW10233.1 hypothetical protein [Flyfo siphovirus Tbat1_6]
MDIEINEVQEIIKNLEGSGELSIKEEKYLKVAKLCVQLAAENVALKTFCKNAAFDADYEAELGMERGGFTDALNNIETPSTDRILAGIKADGVDIIRNALIKFVEDEVGPNDVVPGLIRGAEVCVSLADSLREGADK